MRTVETVSSKYYETDSPRSWIGLVVYACVFILARIGQIPDTNKLALLLAAIIIVIFSRRVQALMCLLFSVFIADDMTIMSGVSYESVVDLIVLLKFLKTRLTKEMVAMVGVIAAFQTVTMFTFNNSLMNVIGVAVRVFLMFLIANERFSEKTVSLISFVGMMSITIGCAIGKIFYASLDWQRFSGIWNDENFCGMYCLIGIVFCLTLITKQHRNAILPVICLIVCAYTGVSTWSRSFIFITSIVFAFMGFSTMVNRKQTMSFKIVALIILIVVFTVLVNYGFSIIIDRRGIIAGNGDFSNGRIKAVQSALTAFTSDFGAIIFGSGVNNTLNMVSAFGYKAIATHNTFIDLIVQFGVPLGIVNYGFLLKNVYCGVRTKAEKDSCFWLFITILTYSLSLSLLQYTLLYVAAGLFISRTKSYVREEKIFD